MAVEYTFPSATEDEAASSGSLRAVSCWEQVLVATVQEVGGGVLLHSPSLLLVTFGVPRTLEQLPQRAVEAALALRQLVVEGPDREPRPALRMAVHWGALLVDVQASDPTMPLRAIGDTLAWPVRLLGQAAAGDILLSPEIGPLVEGWCEVQLREIPLYAGEPGPITVYAVLGKSPPGPWRGRHSRRPPSRFVGRERELALLRELIVEVEGGRGQVVGMIGEPGVGKSRLCDEFLRGSLAPPWRILQTQGTAYGQATPYRPIIDLLEDYFRLDDRDALPTVCEKVTATLRGLDDALAPTMPAFLTLLDVPIEDPKWQTLAAPQRRQRTLDAIKRLLLLESQVQPLLLIVENLHWIDAETQAVLDTLVEGLPAARLFLLTTYRPEYRHGWGNKTYYTQLRLDPLPREIAGALLDALMGDDVALALLKQHLIEWTQGNPFFLEESVRTLVETHALVGGHGAFHLTKTFQSIQVPSTVQAVLAARIDRLAVEEKRLLQTAAVIGTEVSYPLLQAVAERPDEGLRTGLARLQGVEFLYETRLFPELVYTFKHALTQEVAYGSLLQEHRRILHAGIVRAIEALYAQRLAEQVERLAYHAFRGEVWEKAVPYCRQAGEKAMARSAHREAVWSFEQALGALRHLPEQRDTREQAIDLQLTLVSALRPLGAFGRLVAALCEAESLAEGLDDPRRLGRISARLSVHFRLIGAYDQAIAAGERALAHAVASRDIALQALANQYLGLAYVRQGNYRRALACSRQTVAFFDGTQDRDRFGNVIPPAVRSRVALARCHAELGLFAEGRAVGEEGLGIAEAMAHPASLMYASWGLGLLSLRQGDLQGALPRLERAMGLCQDADLPIYIHQIAAPLGAVYALAGRVGDAVPLLTQAIEQATTVEMVVFQVSCCLSLGEAHLLAGRLEEAQAVAERAWALGREHQERGEQAYALRLLGEIAARRELPESESAEVQYRQALTLADALGMRPLMAHCHRGLGTLYAKVGRRQQARSELSAAIEMYRTMEMTFWLPQAERTLGETG